MKASRFPKGDILWVALGGALGAICRASLGLTFPNASLPVGMLMANATGALFLALLYRYRLRIPHGPRVGLMGGFCGSFTTVSLFSFEVMSRLQTKAYFEAGTILLLTLGTVPLVCFFLFLTREDKKESEEAL